jgi:hypothetical protein
LQDISVTMFGFKNGQSYGYPAVMEAGTAILIDDQGMPRARCACGNPLLGPTEDIPDGVDNPPAPDSEDGNPETQDSVPGEDGDQPGGEDGNPETQDSVPGEDGDQPGGEDGDQPGGEDGDQPGGEDGDQPGGEDGDQPGGEDGDQPGGEDGDQPGDEPGIDREPACPDWNSEVIRFTDVNGMLWQYNPVSGLWFSLDDPDLPETVLDQLPGYIDLCGSPGDFFRPACPFWDVAAGKWASPAEFIDANGDRWIWRSDTDVWGKVDSNETSDLIDIPGYVDFCLDPFDSEPSCPSEYKGLWTPYQNSVGDTFVFVPGPDGQTGFWQNEATGQTFGTLEEIPGYIEECGRGLIENPCPPLYPYLGDIWIDSEGDVWNFTSVIIDGLTVPAWENAQSGEALSATDLFEKYCGDPVITRNPAPLCPPGKPVLNELWVDAVGDSWVFGAGQGGTNGWDNLSTPEVESLRTSELPNVPTDCGDRTPPPPPCPPILDVADGQLWVGDNGSIYVFSAAAGGWVGDDGKVIAYTVLLPGYRKQCLPPCPPADAHLYDSPGIWVDPSTGHIWIKPPQFEAWLNLFTRETVDDTRELPFWEQECQPPCAPGSSGEPTFVRDDDGRPVTNPDVGDQYDEQIDNAVVVEPDDSPVQIQQIVQEGLGIVTAIGDDCNPTGCVDLSLEPVLGHLFIDSYGITWRYAGGGLWQSEQGATVTTVLDIPGFAKYCLPEDVPFDRDCPEEFEGNQYTDTRNITWKWVGTNPTPEESDLGKRWFTRYDDGTTEYRYTFQLESFFAGCPKPDGLEGSSDVVVSVRAERYACVGDTVEIVLSVLPLIDGDFVAGYTLVADGEELIGERIADSAWFGEWVPESAGSFDVGGTGITSSGAEGEAFVTVIVSECLNRQEIDNGEPTVELDLKPACVEIGQDDAATLYVTVRGFDGNPVQITVTGGDSSESPQIELPALERLIGNGTTTESFTIAVLPEYAGRTLELKVDVVDGVAPSATASTLLLVEVPGGCSGTDTEPTPSTPTPSTPTPSTPTPSTPDSTPEPEPNRNPSVSYELFGSYSGGACEVRVTATDPDSGQTLYIGANTGEAQSSTSGQVSRTYRIPVSPTGRGTLPAGHRAFDSAGGSVALSFGVVLELVSSINNQYRCVRG